MLSMVRVLQRHGTKRGLLDRISITMVMSTPLMTPWRKASTEKAGKTKSLTWKCRLAPEWRLT